VHETLLAHLVHEGNLDEPDSPEETVSFLRSLYNPVDHHWQNLVSFLVCTRIKMPAGKSFQGVVEGIIRDVSSEEGFAMRHNMLLSLTDGYQSYSYKNKPVAYPRLYNHTLGLYAATGIRIVLANENCDHVIAFIADLCATVSDTAIYPFTGAAHLPVQFNYSPGA